MYKYLCGTQDYSRLLGAPGKDKKEASTNKYRNFHLNKNFYSACSQKLEQATQRHSRVSILGDIQNPAGDWHK